MQDIKRLLQTALSKATPGNRNETGHWLACQLRDEGYSQTEAEAIMREYASLVPQSPEPYTVNEAFQSLKNAYSRPAREKVRGGGVSSPSVNHCYSVTPPQNSLEKTVTHEQSRADTLPLSLENLATAKNIPIDFLRSLGLKDFKWNGKPSIYIPYLTKTKELAAVRFRLTLNHYDKGQRFAWRKGDHVMLYGSDHLDQIRKAGWVLLVEGESNCWTCWLHGIPALGIPGKGVWQADWAKYIKGLSIFLWQDPDAIDLVVKVAESLPEARIIPAPPGVKDISEAQVQGLNVPAYLEELKGKAETALAIKERETNEALKELYQKAREIIEAADPIEKIKEAARLLGYGGDIKPVMLTYLAATSRLLAMREGSMPVHLLLIGPSSSGKSYTVSVVLMLMPPEAYHKIDASSPRAFIYDTASLQHRVLVFGEADSIPNSEDNPASSALRNLLQENAMRYSVTIRDPGTGEFVTKEIEKPGPTVLLTTSTKPLPPQMTTRLFYQEMADDAIQIGAALLAQAEIETKGVKTPPENLIAFQSYLQLKAPIKVIVPFAYKLAEVMARKNPDTRITRDYARLLSLVKSVALLRLHSRKQDSEGRIIAEISDYAIVRDLVNEIYCDTTGAVKDVRSLVEVVRELDATRIEGERITETRLSEYLHISKMAVSRRAKKAIKKEWIVNSEQRKGYPADFVPGEAIPETEGLPTVEQIDTTSVTPAINEDVTDISFKMDTHNTVTPISGRSTPPPPMTEPPDLGMPIQRAIDVWKSQGSPAIPLRQGEKCSNLERFLSSPLTNPDYVKSIKGWLDSVQIKV